MCYHIFFSWLNTSKMGKGRGQSGPGQWLPCDLRAAPSRELFLAQGPILGALGGTPTLWLSG